MGNCFRSTVIVLTYEEQLAETFRKVKNLEIEIINTKKLLAKNKERYDLSMRYSFYGVPNDYDKHTNDIGPIYEEKTNLRKTRIHLKNLCNKKRKFKKDYPIIYDLMKDPRYIQHVQEYQSIS